jgi:signal peptidase II
MRIQNGRAWVFASILIIIEQTIKIVISNHYFNEHFPILSPFLNFSPMFNKDYSWFNSMFQLGVSKWIHVAIVCVMIAAVLLFYQYIRKNLCNNRTVNMMFAFLFSGTFCSLIDKLFWNGSLDYINVKGFFTFDLKDVYIDIFIGLLLIQIVFKTKTMVAINKNGFMKNFMKYYLHKS